MGGVLRSPMGVLALMGAVASAPSALAADIAGATTKDYLERCQKDLGPCRDFTNEVMHILDAAASLGQSRIYKGCAPVPLSPEDTGMLVQWILSRPQQASGYAADDIAMAAESLWPCK